MLLKTPGGGPNPCSTDEKYHDQLFRIYYRYSPTVVVDNQTATAAVVVRDLLRALPRAFSGRGVQQCNNALFYDI